MKVTKFKQELSKMNMQQLQELVDNLRGRLFALRLKNRTAHVKNHAEFRLLKRDIARVLTFINKQDAVA